MTRRARMAPVTAAVTAAAAALAAAMAPPAAAYEFDSSANCPDGYVNAADRSLTFNTANPTLSFGEGLQFLMAGTAAAERINNLGGKWFDYLEPYGTSVAAYGIGVRNGANDIGIADLAGLGGAIGYTEALYDDTNCEIVEADVYMDDDTVTWYVPAYYGIPYYDAAMMGGSLYFARGPLLHEMLHSLGLNHSDTSYSFMNYNVLPWANRSTEDLMIDLLPDDREALRAFYAPGTAVETDVGALITWYDTTSVVGGAAYGKRLCKPSTGVAYSPLRFDPTCGVDANGADGSTEVCPGDNLYVRYALVNYGNVDVTVDEELWFSKNDNLNRTAGFDIASATTVVSHIAFANSSYRWGRVYRVPAGLDWDADYYPIIWLDTGAIIERSEQNNWIPLRATVHVKPQASCP